MPQCENGRREPAVRKSGRAPMICAAGTPQFFRHGTHDWRAVLTADAPFTIQNLSLRLDSRCWGPTLWRHLQSSFSISSRVTTCFWGRMIGKRTRYGKCFAAFKRPPTTISGSACWSSVGLSAASGSLACIGFPAARRSRVGPYASFCACRIQCLSARPTSPAVSSGTLTAG